jgi:hypothetical protein
MLSMGMCMSGVCDKEESSTAETEAGSTVDDARHCDQTTAKTKTKMTIPACMPLQSNRQSSARVVAKIDSQTRRAANSPVQWNRNSPPAMD